MTRHSAVKSRAPARPLERKDDSGTQPQETKQALHDFMSAFEEFKSTNDQRLAEVEEKMASDPLTEEKLQKIDKTLDAYEGINQKMTIAQQNADAIKELGERFAAVETAFQRKGATDPEQKAERINTWARAVVDAHTAGVANLAEDQRKCLEDIREEYKSLSVTPDTAGGYLAPIEYVREIIKGVTEISPARSLVRVRSTAGKAIQIPKRTGQFAAKRVHEGGTKTETTGLEYGLEELTAPEMFALIDITNDMLEDSAFDMQAEINEEATEQFAVLEGQEFVSGSGVGELGGILSNSDVATTNSGSAATIADANGQADGLITLKHAIKTAYTRNATWILNRTSLGAVRRLKDGQNQYIWMPGIAQGRPNSIDGDPYVEMPDMPNEGAGNKPIAYGDFRRAYTMLDRISMEMLRDPYTQATGGKVRFIFRKRTGGKVTLAEAIRTLTCAS